MKKYTAYTLTSLISLCMASITQGMDPITTLGQQGLIEAHIALQPNPRHPIAYSINIRSFDEQSGAGQIKLKPQLPVKRTASSYFNTATQEEITELDLAYYPNKFPLSSIVKQRPMIRGFLQIGAITNDTGNMLLEHFATFTKSQHFIPITEFDGAMAFYDQETYFHVPATITFEDPNKILQQQVSTFLDNPPIIDTAFCPQEEAMRLAIGAGIIVGAQITEQPTWHTTWSRWIFSKKKTEKICTRC